MNITFWQRLDQIGRSLAPAAVTLMLILLGMVPLHLPDWDKVVPAMALMSVYYWSIHRPDLLPPSAAFALGLLQDLLAGTPPGITALVLVCCHLVIETQRAFFLANGFLMLWLGFTFIVFGAALLQGFIYSILAQTLVPMDIPLAQAAMTLAVFPVFASLFISVHRAFLKEI
ncbi:MAG: rod shape-determining protein MreD [Rhodospirillaceae bacterium]